MDKDLILDMGNSENTKEMEVPERESLSSGFGSAIGVPLRIFVGLNFLIYFDVWLISTFAQEAVSASWLLNLGPTNSGAV